MIMKMTAAQDQALKTVFHILRENFDAGVVSVRATDDNGKSFFPVHCCGHLSEVIGLAAMAKESLELRYRMNKVKEQEESEGGGDDDFGEEGAQ